MYILLSISFSVPRCSKPMWQSLFWITSLFMSSTSLSTPCAAGWLGPKFRLTFLMFLRSLNFFRLTPLLINQSLVIQWAHSPSKAGSIPAIGPSITCATSRLCSLSMHHYTSLRFWSSTSRLTCLCPAQRTAPLPYLLFSLRTGRGFTI